MTNLRQNELVHLARLCVQEQGGAAATTWELSERERRLVEMLTKHGRR